MINLPKSIEVLRKTAADPADTLEESDKIKHGGFFAADRHHNNPTVLRDLLSHCSDCDIPSVLCNFPQFHRNHLVAAISV